MLAEHGILGLFSLLILIGVLIKQLITPGSINSKFIKILFGFLALLTLSHSAMRLAMPAFCFALMFLKFNNEIYENIENE